MRRPRAQTKDQSVGRTFRLTASHVTTRFFSTATYATRAQFRASSRAVYARPGEYVLHCERLRAALALPGTEPVQGALADLFYGCRDQTAAKKRQAMEIVGERLSSAYRRWFEPYVIVTNFPVSSRMATRWSVLVRPSIEIPQREMRCSSDDSRSLAQAAVRAWRDSDENAQEEFLQHCWVCRDAMAFMLVRREILRIEAALPERWAAVCIFLQELGSTK